MAIGRTVILMIALQTAFVVALKAGENDTAATEPVQPTAEQAKFFESHVRPLLAERCFKCHGPKEQKGELRLDSLAGLLVGGESGPAIVPGKPQESNLIEAVNYESWKMPPDGKLPQEQIDALTRWVKMGAPWPGSEPSRAAGIKQPQEKISAADRAHWAYQPVKKPAAQGAGVRGQESAGRAIDGFIQARLEVEGLSPAPQADRATLIRRASFDLIGLPPTPAEVDAFIDDSSPDAYERLIDRLLESPRYGEHWGRHWLDLVRYAESDGFKQDAFREDAWRYRDYVIRSLNDDKSYRQFILEQLAGDELNPQNPDASIATGFLRHGIYEYNQVDVRRQRSDILNEVTDVTADVFLAMGMGCARCHDHKFDPILQTDYYRLQAFFAPMVWREDLPVATPAERKSYEQKLAAWEQATAEIRRQISALEQSLGPLRPGDLVKRFPQDIQDLLNHGAADRSPLEEQLYQLALRQVTPFVRNPPSGEVKKQLDQLQKKLAEFQDRKPAPLPVAYGVTDVGPVAPPTTVPGGKNPQPLEPAFPEVLGGVTPTIEALTEPIHSTGRRTALANWIASPNNPLTARVLVNRIWQHHFGRGLAASASDFGKLGELPTHPELLDWLAAEFVEHGWSIKQMHRLIMTSATYRQSAWHSASKAALAKDPQNYWLWRQNCRRLEAEQVRDLALAATGELDLQMFGPSVLATKPRRTIYTKVIRNTRDPLLDVFDVPDGYLSVAQRNITTTPTQALLMINGDWTLARAKSLAERLESMSDESVIQHAYHIVLGRRPTQHEASAARQFLVTQQSHVAPQATVGHSSLVQKMPQREGNAAVIDPTLPQTVLTVPDSTASPTGDFTIEAYVLLNSLADNAASRTIAAQWDGDSKSAGWTFGVAGNRSSGKPGNLILQFSPAASPGGKSRLCDSELPLQLNCPYYVAAVVRLSSTKDAGVTFYVKDLSNNDAPLLSKHLAGPLAVTNPVPQTFTMGGLNASQNYAWDGLIDDVRFSAAALTEQQLLWQNGSDGAVCIGHWKFEDTPGFDQDSSDNKNHIVESKSSALSAAAQQRRAVLVDFCHVLLNSSEFIYVD